LMCILWLLNAEDLVVAELWMEHSLYGQAKYLIRDQNKYNSCGRA